MKKILYAVCFWALLAGLTSSCSKETRPCDDEFTVTATIAANDTKVSYSEDGSTHKLLPSWQDGDKIIGFDTAGNKYCYQVQSISGQTAYFELVKTGEYTSPTSKSPSNGTVMYMIYAPGKKASDIYDTSLNWVNLNDQGDSIPAIMTAKATVTDNNLSLNFINGTAIVCIKSPTMATANQAYSSITISGKLVKTQVNISIDGSGDFQMSFNTNPGPNITKTVNFTSDGSKHVTEVFYFAVPPTPSLSALTFTTDNDERFIVSAPPLEAGRYYYISPTFEKSNSGTVLEFANLTWGDTL